MSGFGSQVRARRLRAGYTQRALAPKAEIDFTYLSKVENGEADPSADLVRRLADLLGADRDDFLALAGRLPCRRCGGTGREPSTTPSPHHPAPHPQDREGK